MRSLGTFLESLGLAQYVRAFIESDIDLETLPLLTDGDLENLGLTLGHRRKLLKAVEGLSAGAPIGAARAQETPHMQSAERRQLTILFCDLVGSTALARQLDPEPLRELMQAYQQCCRDVVARYDGHVAQYLGDGLMVYFGYPRAHEDDAERAVRSGLDIVSSLANLDASGMKLQVRIGIATGPVVVGETGAGDASVPKLAVGETPNVAARLQSLAGPDEIIIAPATQRLVGTVFELCDRGEHRLKGIVEAVRAWQVLGLRAGQGRFEATRGETHLTPWVGRESELALLWDRWTQACAGEGQLVLINGEPGIGKSRITQALRARIDGTSYRRLDYQCSPFHTQNALYPVIEHMLRAASFERADAVDAKLDKLEVLLKDGEASKETIALFASMLSLPVRRYPALNYSPQKQKDLLLAALVEHIAQLAQRTPLLLLVEDAHWIDPTTHEALDLLAPRLAMLPILMLITHRPEYAPRWAGEAHVTHLSLNRLNRRLAVQLTQKVGGGKPLPVEVLDQIVAKTDGVPLFVEELTKAVLESSLVRETATHYELTGPLPPLAIPSTLHDSLMARLDRLPAVKEIAQMGACIGREFGFELLAALTQKDESQLAQALEQLTQAGLVFRQGIVPQAIYTFKHALVQDIAYESLLKSRRQQMHARLVYVLETQFPELVADEPATVATHCAASGSHEKAATYWHTATQQALSRFANAEAKQRALLGLASLEGVPESQGRDQLELVLRIACGTAQFSVAGYASDEVGKTYARARELSTRVGDSPQHLLVMFGLWVYFFVRGEYSQSAEFAGRIRAIAEDLQDERYLLLADVTSLADSTPVARFRDAILFGESALARSSAEMIAWSRATIGVDMVLGAHDWMSWSLALVGRVDQAISFQQRAIDSAEQQEEPNMTAQVLAHTALVDYFRNDPLACAAHAAKAIEVSQMHGIPLRLAEGHILQGWANSESGNSADSLSQVELGIDGWNRIGARIANPVWYCMLAQAYWKHGDLAKARNSLDRAFEEFRKTGEHLWEAELHRVDGALCLAENPIRSEDVESRYRRSMEVAQSQGAKLIELRAATSLAQLRLSQSRPAEALALIQPVYDQFTEGFDSPDLVLAREVMNIVRP